jgi:hypothetical protein
VGKLQRFKFQSPTEASRGKEQSVNRRLPIVINSEDDDENMTLMGDKEELGRRSSYDQARLKTNRNRSSSRDIKPGGSDSVEVREALRVALSKLDSEVNPAPLCYDLVANAPSRSNRWKNSYNLCKPYMLRLRQKGKTSKSNSRLSLDLQQSSPQRLPPDSLERAR